MLVLCMLCLFLCPVGFSIGDYWSQVTALDKPLVWPSVSIHILLCPSGGIFTSDLKIINALKSRKNHPMNFLCRLFMPSSGRISDFLLSCHHPGLWEMIQIPLKNRKRSSAHRALQLLRLGVSGVSWQDICIVPKSFCFLRSCSCSSGWVLLFAGEITPVEAI